MAEFCAAIVQIVVGLPDAPAKIKQCVLDPIKAQFSYLFRYINFIQSLRGKNEELNLIRNGLQSEIDTAKRDLYEIKPDVVIWCERVDELKKEIDRILGAEPRVQNGTCLQGKCQNLKLQYSHSREAEKLITDIVECLNDYNRFRDNIKGSRVPLGSTIIPPTYVTPEFDSRKEIEEEIMSCLKDRSISMIEIWGMGGVGKTTLADKIRTRAIELFDETVKAVVSQQTLEQIQEELAEGLNLQLTEKTVPKRAERLYTRLKDKNVLISLDDVWKPLKLEELGIPPQIKILLTTRNHGVSKSMSTEKATRILKLEVLNEEEAFTFFCNNAGNVVNGSNLHQLARDVANECKGLPLALKTVGRSLRGKNARIWEASLRQLKKAAPTYITEYLQDVWLPLKLSYDQLENNEAQYLFLFCCLFPEDSKIEIENLVRYVVGLRIFSARSISDARDKVDLLVKRLIDRCLLMSDDRESLPTYVTMHDVMRDVALLIASSGGHVFMVSHDKDLEILSCISLTLGKALILTLDLMDDTQALPINILNGMEDLTLLSICGTVWSTFRLSLSFLSSLTKLRVLHLHQCGLKNISLIGQLKDLEILSCRGSDIQVLPDKIGGLKNLRLLDMTDCGKLEAIASGVFSALKELEELRLMGCPIRWECEEEGDERINASLTQVFSLENLTLLEIWIQDLKAIFQKMGDKQNLEKYSILIGGDWYEAIEAGRSHTYYLKCMSVRLDRVDQRSVFPDAISKLFKGAEQLQLKGNGCEGIIELVGREGFKNTKSLEIDGLNYLEKIYDGPPPVELFSVLEYLSLRELNGLVYLWKCPNPKFSMSKLKEIRIEKCTKLKWLLPLPLSAESFSQLESIEVRDCSSIEEVFRISESDITTSILIKFPILKRMILDKLPKLGALCNAVDAVIECPSIKRLEITEMSPNFKVFGNRMDQVACTELIMSHLGMEIFYHKLPTGFVFSGLEQLKIESFQCLTTLFSLAVFKSLGNLNYLWVEDCMMLEYIVEMEDEKDIIEPSSGVLSLPHLQSLLLLKLPRIRCFWLLISNALELPLLENIMIIDCLIIETFAMISNALELPSLKTVIIQNCPMMETFAVDQSSYNSSSMPNSSIPKSFFGKQVSCPKLGYLRLEGLKVSGLLFSPEIPIASLAALHTLEIESCHNLQSLFTSRMFGGLTSLDRMEVTNCSMLELVIVKDEVEKDVDDGEMVVSLPNLSVVVLEELPKLRGFSHMHRDLELPSLGRINICNCTEMRQRSFCVGPGCVRMPTGARVDGISNPEFASQFFFPKQQHCQSEDSLDNGSFMLLPSDLSFTWSSEGERLVLVKTGSSYVFFLDGWKKVYGKFDMKKLSPEIMYEIAFVIMLLQKPDEHDQHQTILGHEMMDKPIEKWIEILAREVTILGDEEREHKMMDKPIEKWIEILAGEVTPSSGQCGEITFSLEKDHCWKSVALRGVSIRPKATIA